MTFFKAIIGKGMEFIRATHANLLQDTAPTSTAAFAFVSYGFVLVRVRVRIFLAIFQQIKVTKTPKPENYRKNENGRK